MQASSRLMRTTTLLRSTSSSRASSATTSTAGSSSSSSSSRNNRVAAFPISNVRTFSYSPLPWAREAGSNNPFEEGPTQFQQEHAPLFERVMQHPEVMESIEHMAKLTQSKTGVDLQAGDKPSLSMMYTLARDPELRSAAERLMSSLKRAGIEVDPKEAFKALQMMGGEGFPGGGGGLGDLHREVNKGKNNGGSGRGQGEGENK